MPDPVVIIGLGQMGGTFAHGFLRCGRCVHPVTRAMNEADVARQINSPALVLVAVTERDLDGVLRSMPDTWRDRVALLSNEILPQDWERHDLDPTIAIVWFEKKRDTGIHVVLPTLVAKTRSHVLVEALTALEIPVAEIDESRLLFELVRKNLYILTSNIAGLEVGGTVGELWTAHRDLTRAVALEVLALQAWRAGTILPQDELLEAMVEAFDGDPSHRATGRSAPERLRRALDQAKQAKLPTPTLERIAADVGTARQSRR